MHLKTYLFNKITSRKFRLNGLLPSNHLPNKQKLCQAFRDHVLYSPDQLPPKVDLRNDMTAVEDQSKIGSCAANCLAGAYEYLTKKSNGRNTDVSRLFIYYNSRAKEKQSRGLSDSGCTMTSAIEALEEFGTCLESIWPYNISEVNARPSDRAYQEAKNHKITEALKIGIDLNEMKSCLAQGFPFAFGLKLFKSFDMASKTGVVPMPNASDRGRSSHGSHALLAVGYSDQSKSFIVRNSWGADWGAKGYCYIPYDYMTNPDLCFDAWAVRKLANDNFSKEHWDNNDSINYLRAAVIELLSGTNNSNYDDDSCAIEEVHEDDYSNKSGIDLARDNRSNQLPNNPGWDRYNNNSSGSGGPCYQQQNAVNNYPTPGASSYYDQQQQYAGGGYNYNQQQQWGGAGYDQYGAGFQPNNNFTGQYQNQYQDNSQGVNPNYNNYPNNFSQFPPSGMNQNYPNTGNPPSLADIMNSSGTGNQQYGMGFDYSNTQYNYPNQYGQ